MWLQRAWIWNYGTFSVPDAHQRLIVTALSIRPEKATNAGRSHQAQVHTSLASSLSPYSRSWGKTVRSTWLGKLLLAKLQPLTRCLQATWQLQLLWLDVATQIWCFCG